jgi:hypothetical protein
VPAGGSEFLRVEVRGGKTLPGAVQGVTGIKPGQQVVANALAFEATAEQ